MTTVKPVNQRFSKRILRGALLSVVMGAVSMASVAQTNRIELPDLGASAGQIATPAQEQAYAAAVVRQMRAANVLIEDPLVVDWFEHMGYRIASHTEEPETPFTFVVIDEPVVNAFAAPGGLVAMFTGMILAADNEDEIAGVLAHEAAHVTQMHVFRGIEKAQSMTIPMILAMVGLALAGGGSGQAIQSGVMAAQGLGAQAQINYTRENEQEADRIGIQTMWQAGYDPVAMGSMFDKLGRVTRPNGEGPPEYLRTHPLSTSRVADAKNRAHNLPLGEPNDSTLFLLMQARIRAITEDRPEDAVAHFNHRLRADKLEEKNRKAYLYGLGIAEKRRGNYEKAADIFAELADGDPMNLVYQLAIADLDLQRGESLRALDRLGRLYHSFPGNHAITVQYAQTLVAQNDPDKAEIATVILRQELIAHNTDPGLFELYARAANIAGDHVRASEAMAESYYQRGGVYEAVQQLERLAQQNDLDYYERARITARLTELRIQMLAINRARSG